MKLQKLIAIILISFANVFILAHAVVPHYHHDGIVCFDAEQNDCQTYNAHGSSDECCKHEDKHHSHLDDCNLSQMVERQGNPIDDDTVVYPTNVQTLVCICTIHCYNLYAKVHALDDRYKLYNTFTNNYISPYVGSAHGLRAPPSIIS